MRPQAGDRLAYSSGPRRRVGRQHDGGRPARDRIAEHPESEAFVRDGSRLNEVLLVRLDPKDLAHGSRQCARTVSFTHFYNIRRVPSQRTQRNRPVH